MNNSFYHISNATRNNTNAFLKSLNPTPRTHVRKMPSPPNRGKPHGYERAHPDNNRPDRQPVRRYTCIPFEAILRSQLGLSRTRDKSCVGLILTSLSGALGHDIYVFGICYSHQRPRDFRWYHTRVTCDWAVSRGIEGFEPLYPNWLSFRGKDLEDNCVC